MKYRSGLRRERRDRLENEPTRGSFLKSVTSLSWECHFNNKGLNASAGLKDESVLTNTGFSSLVVRVNLIELS